MGRCSSCPMGFTVCGLACTDTRADSNHCGRCDNRCETGLACVSGACQACPSGQTACGGACVDTAANRLHCGRCSNRCPLGENCVSGLCCGDTSCSGCPDGCIINGACVTSRARNPANDCQECRPSSDPRGWTDRADAQSCATGGRAGLCLGGFGARACCTGCWNGSACSAGTSGTSCGVGGDRCIACECPADSCSGGACSAQGPWAEVFAGVFYTCARKADGTIWCWGYNAGAQLGTGDTTERLSPTQVGSDNDWTSLSAGFNNGDRGHVCAIKRDRSLWCWGWNGTGCLGTGDRVNRTAPVMVGVTRDWAQVSVGDLHTCARKLDGTLWCWGNNSQGELGTGDGRSSDTPARVGNGVEWSFIAAGGPITCGIQTDRTLWCWGRNNEGLLPFPDNMQRGQPTMVGSDTNWSRVWLASGGLALKTDGTLWTWGFNGMTASGTAPRAVMGGYSDWVSGAISYIGSCGIRRDGTLWCWGGRDGVPARVSQISDIASVAHTDHTCARSASGAMWCWGSNRFGMLGLGDRTDRNAPARLCP